MLLSDGNDTFNWEVFLFLVVLDNNISSISLSLDHPVYSRVLALYKKNTHKQKKTAKTKQNKNTNSNSTFSINL